MFYLIFDIYFKVYALSVSHSIRPRTQAGHPVDRAGQGPLNPREPLAPLSPSGARAARACVTGRTSRRRARPHLTCYTWILRRQGDMCKGKWNTVEEEAISPSF